MADDLQNFFDSAAPAGNPVSENKPERKKRTPRTPNKTADAAASGAAAAPPKKRGRKPKENGMSKIDVAVAVSVFAGLTAEEGGMVAKAAGVLNGMPKGSRSRIVSALARLFA